MFTTTFPGTYTCRHCALVHVYIFLLFVNPLCCNNHVILLFVQDEFAVNKELLNGRNALHYAADYGQVEVIKYLCSKNADVNVSSSAAFFPYRDIYTHM